MTTTAEPIVLTTTTNRRVSVDLDPTAVWEFTYNGTASIVRITDASPSEDRKFLWGHVITDFDDPDLVGQEVGYEIERIRDFTKL